MPTQNEYRAALVEERRGGWKTGRGGHASELLDGGRRHYAVLKEALYALVALRVLYRPGAELPLAQAIPLEYAEPLAAPDPVPPLPAWIAGYLRQVAEELAAPLCQVVRRRDAAGLAWCRRQLEETGEALYLWLALSLLELRAGAELPAWAAAALFRVARDLDDTIAGRDLRRRPRSSDLAELCTWQARERRWPLVSVDSEGLLAVLGFRRASRDAFSRVHAQMVAARDFPTCFRRRRAAPKIHWLAVLPAFGIPNWRADNPVKRMQRRLLDRDAAHAFDAASEARQEAQRMRAAGRDPLPLKSGGAAACEAMHVGADSLRYVTRRATEARRLSALLDAA